MMMGGGKMSCVQGCVGTGHASSGIAPGLYMYQ